MYTLLIPKNESLKEKKTGRNAPFWKGFWEKNLAENPTHYKKQYEQRLSRLDSTVKTLNSKYGKTGKKFYVEATLDAFVDAKTKEPSEIWTETGVQIVETRDDGTITLSGTPDAFNKLSALIGQANFNAVSQLKSSKRQNLAREIFSVTAIHDKNASTDKRISKDISALISSGGSNRVNCILSVYFDRSQSEYDELYGILKRKVGAQVAKVDPNLFVNNMYFRGQLNASEINSVLGDPECNFINFIKMPMVFEVQRTTPNTTPRSLQIGKPLTDEIAVVIDSGINNSVINKYVSVSEKLLNNGDIPDTNHGTSVASRLLFGGDIFSGVEPGKEVYPVGQLIDMQIAHKNSQDDFFVPDDRLTKAIDDGVRKYGRNSTIFNLSISATREVDELNVSEITELIDARSNQNDVLFVCAVGNQNSNFPLGYKGIFNAKNTDCRIAAPADALNALSVGSIAAVADINSICPTPNHPSPFTRKGGIRNDYKKPELVASGGNIKIDPAQNYDVAHLKNSHRVYGVEVIDTGGFSHDAGTSFSAPLVSRECLRLLGYLKRSNLISRLPAFSTNKANLIKALLIHSTERQPQAKITNLGLKQAYGWGQADSQTVIRDNDNQITFVYADRINFAEKKQKILIKLPEFLMGKPVEFTVTLVYNPPVNKNFKEYKMIELKPSIAFIHPANPNSIDGKTDSRGNNPPHSWDDYRNPHFNTIHFKKRRKKLTGLDFQVLTQMFVSNRLLEEHAGREVDIFQNYALVVTVKDLSESGQLRNDILNSNQFFELVENVVEIKN